MTRRNDTYTQLFIEHGIDIPGRTLLLNGSVDEDMLTRATKFFHVIPKGVETTILINSGGGDTYYGMAIVDLIHSSEACVTIQVVGQAYSMACVILQAGDIRLATRNSVLMHHVGEVEYPQGHPKNTKAFIRFDDKHNDRIDQLMLKRLNEKGSWTMAQWKQRDVWDRFLHPEEAIELGLLDNIIGD